MIRLPHPSFVDYGRSRRSPATPSLSLPLFQPANMLTAAARRGIALVPSWVLLGMILLAAVAICLTVNLRATSERSASEAQLNRLSIEIETLRRSNASLQMEIQRMSSDPAIIEFAARTRLGMAKPTDIVVSVPATSGTNLATLSFVR